MIAFTFKVNDGKTDSSNTGTLNMSKWYSLTVSKAELCDHNDKSSEIKWSLVGKC
jgi:hypothetical protein